MSSGKESGDHPNPLRLIWKTDPKRPIFSALLEAEFQMADRVFDDSLANSLTKRAAEVKSASEANMLFDEFTVLFQEAREILNWIFPHQQKSFDFILTTAKIMKYADFPEDMIKSVMKRLEHKPRGRPVTKRQIAIKALEKQMLEPERRWSYRQLAQKFCKCGKDKHDSSCAQALRQSMLQLRKILAKYAPHLPVNNSE
jgi:hypothetical protein